jgi:hypothetical protein
MASVLVPDEAASHLGAILLTFNRQIFGSFLDEADKLAGLGLATSAILIAGTVLEYFERSPAAGVLPPERRRQIAEWRELRNQVARFRCCSHRAASPTGNRWCAADSRGRLRAGRT